MLNDAIIMLKPIRNLIRFWKNACLYGLDDDLRARPRVRERVVMVQRFYHPLNLCPGQFGNPSKNLVPLHLPPGHDHPQRPKRPADGDVHPNRVPLGLGLDPARGESPSQASAMKNGFTFRPRESSANWSASVFSPIVTRAFAPPFPVFP